MNSESYITLRRIVITIKRLWHWQKNCNHYQKIITLTATHSEEKTTTNARHAPAAGEHLGSSPWYYDANIINGKIAAKIVI